VRRNTRKAKTIDDHGGRQDSIMASPRVHKSRDKSWHDRHIKRKHFKEGHLVLVYDSKYLQHPGKLRIHWLGPYELKTVTEWGVV
jgi:hypothetical protein